MDKYQERFFRKILIKDGCWIWTGSKGGTNGYGQIRVNGRLLGAHRYSYSLFKGEVPIGMEICHSCDTPACVNPQHLEAATHGENIKDSYKRGRKNRNGIFVFST